MKLSIITINFNNRDGLRKTIESVVNQTWQEFEYIIIDGGSTDGSVEVIKEYADRIDYWVSEPDKGIYHAMNKGIDQAKGEYCLFMNSGDCIYQPTMLEKVHTELDGYDVICGEVVRDFDATKKLNSAPHTISLAYLYNHTLPHQATFIRNDILHKFHYDEAYKIVSDWKFFIVALVINNGSYQRIPNIIANYDTTGISSTNTTLLHIETETILKQLIPERILIDYHTMLLGEKYEDKLYIAIKTHRFHKIFYALNLAIVKIYSLFNKKTKWVKEYPFNI